MKQKPYFHFRFGKTEYYENIERAMRYNYPFHFDIRLLPSLRICHTKGEWTISLSWLLWGLSLWVMLPVYEYDVLYYTEAASLENPEPAVFIHHFNNLRGAIKFSIQKDGAIRRV